MGLIYRKINKF